jgi:hypothetical protein
MTSTIWTTLVTSAVALEAVAADLGTGPLDFDRTGMRIDPGADGVTALASSLGLTQFGLPPAATDWSTGSHGDRPCAGPTDQRARVSRDAWRRSRP